MKNFFFRTIYPKAVRPKYIIIAIFMLSLLISFFFYFKTEDARQDLLSPNNVVTEQADQCDIVDNPTEDMTPPIQHIRSLSKGETLWELLIHEGVDSNEAYAAISALKEMYDPRHLKPDQEIALLYEQKPDAEEEIFHGLRIKVDKECDIEATRGDENDFIIREIRKNLQVQPERTEGIIKSSFYESANEAGLPISLLMELISLFSFDVDFQRDIQPEDKFEILFQRHLDEEGKVVRDGPILYAALTLQGTPLRLYRHTTLKGKTDYFNEKGQSAKKTLLRTPVNGARLSSGYGMRRHPILGYSRMHKGLDFAAPSGTPVMASGNGVVASAGRKGNYGKYIRIRHANGYSTAYAHLRCYARGMRCGKRVKQGDIIGQVGSTGMSTGPHLHYEVLYRNKQVNPAHLKFPPGYTLSSEELKQFKVSKNDLNKLIVELDNKTNIACTD